jgi:6-phosphogluconolactonase (cycloisomerase 2 family)
MKRLPGLLLLLAPVCSLAACTETGPRGATGPTGPQGSAGPQGSGVGEPDTVGAVYAMSNDPSHNEVWAFARHSDGSLGDSWAFPTGGAGTGTALADQGAIFLDAAAKQVFAVNAGDNTISMLAIADDGSLDVVGAPVASGGVKPVSITEHAGAVYVLNAGDANDAPNVAGFTASATGLATNSVALPLSTTSAASAAPAQISFTPDASHLVVTEKGTGEIDTYAVDGSGVASGLHSQLAAGGATATPYGFGFSGDGTLLVTEAAGAVSSYAMSAEGALTATTTSASTHQAAPCWMAAAGTWGWAINAGSDSITGFTVGAGGAITLTTPTGVAATTANKPLDAALSSDGKFLYVIAANDHALSTYAVNADSTLTRMPDVLGLPAAAEGLAAD